MDVAELVLKGDSRAIVRASTDLDNLTKSGEKAEKSWHSSSQKITSDAKKVSGEMKLLKQVMAGLFGGFSVAVVLSGMEQMRREATQFKAALAEVSTLLNDTREIAEYNKQSKELAKTFGTMPIEQTKAFYSVISAGAKDAKDATATLTAANKLAIGGVTDINTAVDGLTSTLNAYQLSGEKATYVSDAFFVAMKAGKTTIGEISSSIGNVASTASAAGIPLEELLASVAALTTSGLQTSVAMNSIRQTVVGILKPTKEAADEAARLGISFDAQTLKSKGLTSMLAEIQEKTNGNVESITKLFGSVEAFGSVVALTGPLAEKYSEIIEQMGDKAGATAISYEKMAQEMEQQNKILAANFATLRVEIGEKLLSATLPALQKVNANFGEIISTLGALLKIISLIVASHFIKWIYSVIAAKAIAIQQAIAYQMALARMAGASTLAATAQGALAGAIGLVSKAFALIGGPLGAAMLAAGAIFHFREELGLVPYNADRAATAIDGVKNRLNDLTSAGAAAEKLKIIEELQKAEKAFEKTRVEIKYWEDALKNAFGQLSPVALKNAEERLIVLRDRFEKNENAVNGLNKTLIQLDHIINGTRKEFLDYEQTLEDLLIPAELLTRQTTAQTVAIGDLGEETSELIDKLTKEKDALTKTEREILKLSAGYKNASAEKKKEILALFDSIKATENYKKAKEDLTEELKRHDEYIQQVTDSYERLRGTVEPAFTTLKNLKGDLKILSDAYAEGVIQDEKSYKKLRDLVIDHHLLIEDTKRKAVELSDEANPLAESWQAALERIDNAFVELWKNAFDGFKDFGEALKQAFFQLLAELAHRATTQKILISLGLGGPGSALAGGSGGPISAGGIFSSGGLLNVENILTGGGILGGVNYGLLQGAGWLNTAISKIPGIGYSLATQNAAALNSMAKMPGGMAGGMAVSALAGYAGNWAGGKAGSALFGKTAESNIGGTVGGVIGSIWGPIGTAIGSFFGGMLDAAFGGDGKKRLSLGVSTDPNRNTSSEYISYETDTLSGLHLSSYAKRVGEEGDQLAQQLTQTFGAIDYSLTTLYDTLGHAVDLTGQTLAGKDSEYGLNDYPSFFGATGYNEIDQADIEGAADDFVRAWVKKVNEITGANLDLEPIFDLAGEGELLADALLRVQAEFAAVNPILSALGLTTYDLSVAGMVAADGLAQAMGGLENLVAASDFYYQNFYDEGERARLMIDQYSATIAGFNEQFGTALDGKDDLRAFVDALDLTTEAGQNAFAAAMNLAPAFVGMEQAMAVLDAKSEEWAKSVVDAFELYLGRPPQTGGLEYWVGVVKDGSATIEDVMRYISESPEALEYASQSIGRAITDVVGVISDVMRKLLDESKQLEIELMRAQGDTAGADAASYLIAIQGMSGAEIAIYDYNQSLRDQISALEAAAEAEKAVAQERAGLEAKLLQLQGSAGELRQKELEALDPSNWALQELIWSIEDTAIAAQEAAQAEAELAQIQQAIAQERYGLETQLLQLLGDTAELRARELATLDETNRPLLELIYSLEDQAKAAEEARIAAEALAQAERAIAQERYGLETQLLQLLGDTAELRRRELELLDPSNRALQEQIWALQDAAQATELLAQAERDLAAARKQEIEDAYNILSKSVDAEKELITKNYNAIKDGLQDSINVVSEALRLLESDANLLKNALGSLSVESDYYDQLNRRRALKQLKTGSLTGDSLDSALSAATNISTNEFATFADYAFAIGQTKSVIAGLLDEKESQLSIEEKTIARLEDQLTANEQYYEAQIESLNSLLDAAQQQIDILNGIDVSVWTLSNALQHFNSTAGSDLGLSSPSFVFPPSALPGGDGNNSQEVVAEIRQLREYTEAGLRETAKNTKDIKKLRDVFEKWDADGLPAERTA